jgi:hypothetical protein
VAALEAITTRDPVGVEIMKITKHTPGPWTADTGDHEGTDVLTSHHDNCCGVMATIHNQPGEDMPGTVEVANARLIAAAPDLLAALQELDDAYRSDQLAASVGVRVDDHYNASTRYDIIAAAIAKATGRLPEMVECDCGHECGAEMVMSASMGTACPDCYDTLSD